MVLTKKGIFSKTIKYDHSEETYEGDKRLVMFYKGDKHILTWNITDKRLFL